MTRIEASQPPVDRQARRLALLSEIAAGLLLHERPQELLEKLFEKISGELGLEVYLNFLVHPPGDHLVLGSFAGMPEDLARRHHRVKLGEAVCGTVAWRRAGMVVERVQDRQDEMTCLIRSIGIKAYFCHPLMAWGRLLGTLSFGTRRRESFEPDELELMQTACDLVAAALERARLISELVERGRDTEVAWAAAEAASRTKDRFLATLSHELRTPLTPVLLSAQGLCADPRLPAELRLIVERMHRNIQFEVRLIDDLLDLTRIAQGKIQIHPEVVDVHGLIAHAAEICAGAMECKKIRLRQELRAEESWVWGDPARLEQILWNILSNAVKFSDEGSEVVLRTVNEPEGCLDIQVTDQGIGIAPEALAGIFDAFEQGSAQITRHFGGLGLGLAISKALTELHGGSIRADSPGRGKGATFTLRLKTVPQPGEETLAGLRQVTAPPRGLKILLVEDHADTAEAVAELLSVTGHDVNVARSVQEALSRAQALHEHGGLDLVISDLGLPDGSGIDLLPELRRLYGVKGIALSGYGMEEDLQRSRAAGFEVHLTKPVAPQALVEAISRVAGGSPT